MSIFRPLHILIASLVVSLVAVAPAAAQQAALSLDPVAMSVSTPAVEITTATIALGPTVRNTTVGVRAIQPLGAPEPAPMQYAATNRNIAWMIVGGAGLIVGSIIGGDAGTIVMVGSGVIGLVGLFRYLN